MEQFFQILNIVVPTLILALFAVHYQLRKKTEIRIETQLARQRIQSYEIIHSVFGKILQTESLPIRFQKEIDDIMEYYDIPNMGTDYSVVLATGEGFDYYYQNIKDAVANNLIFLDYSTVYQISKSLSILTEIKNCLDAFHDSERMSIDTEMLESVSIEQKTNYAYLIASIVLKNDYNRIFLDVEDEILKQMSDIEVIPSKKSFKRFCNRFRELLASFASTCAKLHNQKLAKFSERLMFKLLGKDQSLFSLRLQQLYYLLEYIHVSDKYSFEQYLKLSQQKHEEISRDFWSRMFMQVHI